MNAILGRAIYAARVVTGDSRVRTFPPKVTAPIKEPIQVLHDSTNRSVSVDVDEVLLRDNARLKAEIKKLKFELTRIKKLYGEPLIAFDVKTPRPIMIMRVVANRYHVSLAEMIGASRRANFVAPRHVSIYLIKHLTLLSFPQIGRAFHRDHTSILHGYRKISEQRKIDPELDAELTEIESLFQHDVDADPSARTSSSEPAAASPTPAPAGSLIQEGA